MLLAVALTEEEAPLNATKELLVVVKETSYVQAELVSKTAG